MAEEAHRSGEDLTGQTPLSSCVMADQERGSQDCSRPDPPWTRSVSGSIRTRTTPKKTQILPFCIKPAEQCIILLYCVFTCLCCTYSVPNAFCLLMFFLSACDTKTSTFYCKVVFLRLAINSLWFILKQQHIYFIQYIRILSLTDNSNIILYYDSRVKQPVIFYFPVCGLCSESHRPAAVVG